MAENVQELIIKYKADISELQSKVAEIEATIRKAGTSANAIGEGFKSQTGLIENTRKRIQQLTEARDKSNDTTKIARFNSIISDQSRRLDELTGKHSQVAQSLTPMGQALDNIGKGIIAAFAVERIIQFGFASVQAFQDAEKNAVKLQSAVSVNGGLQHDFDELIKQSEELQKVTIFSDDAVQNAQTAALQFGLTREEVQALIPVVADFASATGQDLQSALEGVLQGVNGAERGLKKYGVSLSEGGTRASRLNEITDQLTKKFEGQAEVIGKTAFGAAERYNNELDEMQENLGERLSPILQNLRGFFLELADGAVFALEKIIEFNPVFNALFGQAAKGMAELSAAASQLNSVAIADAKKAFQTLSDANIVAKVDVLTEALQQAKNEAAGKSAVEAQAANERIQEYATQITALRLIQAERKAGLSGLNQEAEALAKLQNIGALTDADLKSLALTLSRFNSIDAQDGIDLITKELEARQKGTAKMIEDRRKGLDELSNLEKKASDRLLSVKAQEVSKITALEQTKQKELRDLITAAGTASGVDVEPITLEFQQTGRADIDKTLALLRNAKFPEEEIQKFIQAVKDTSSAFDVLIQKETEASKAVELKINTENIQNDFADLRDQFDQFQRREDILIQVRFLQAGDFSPEAVAKFEADLVDSRTRTNNELIRQAQQMGVEQSVIDDLVLTAQEEANRREIEANKAKNAAILASDQELAQKKKEILQDIQDMAIQFAETLITSSIDRRAEADLDAVERTEQAELDSIETRIDANDERARKQIIGEREAQANHEKLVQERKKVNEKADNAERQIKRRQFKNDQFAAVAKVVIANTVNAAEFPALAAFYAAAAIVQLGIILAEPNPYAKGSKNTKPGLSIVGEEGPEFLMMPQGAKVVTAQKTKKHAAVIDAIMDDRFDEHIQKTFVEPALQQEKLKDEKKSKKESKKAESKQIVEVNSVEVSKDLSDVSHESYSGIIEAIYMGKVDEYLKESQTVKEVKKQDVIYDSIINHRELNTMLSQLQVAPALKEAERNHEVKKQEDFATNIANTFHLNSHGLTRKDYRQLSDENRRRGTYFRNASEIVDPIIEALRPLHKQSFRR